MDDGPLSGPVVNSRRQLWSVAAFVSVIHDVILGIEVTPEGTLAPYFILLVFFVAISVLLIVCRRSSVH